MSDMATFSKQPRFGATESYAGTLYWPVLAEIEQVPYAADSRARDKWLRNFWKLEPRLAGIVAGVTLLDSNRGWTLTGGRNQVRRFTQILHAVEGGQGWRTLARKLSLSYWCTDMGAVAEIGRDGEGGPLRGLYHVDSARCKLTGDPEWPLEYFPATGAMQRWAATDFIRFCSLPSDDESFKGLGFCAVSRCVEMERLLYAVMVHDQEQLAARMPRGLLLLHGITQEQWEESLRAREAQATGLERRWYGGVQILANAGTEQLDAKLVALSQLPVGFDAKSFIDLTLYSYALCFGYDPSEFWPVQFGSLGRGTEAEIQSLKAMGKGGMDFALVFQEQLQRELPGTIAFEFEERDDLAVLRKASSDKAQAEVIKSLYEAGLQNGAPLISREEARILLAQAGLISEEWTADIGTEMVTDTEDVEDKQAEQRWLELEQVQRAMQTFADEDIVQFTWPRGVWRTLWEAGQRNVFRAAVVARQGWERGQAERKLTREIEEALLACQEEVGNAGDDKERTDEALEVLAAALLSLLISRFMDFAADIFWDQVAKLGTPVNFDAAMSNVQVWAFDHATSIVDDVMEVSWRHISIAQAKLIAGDLTEDDYVLSIAPWFSASRAETIAVTEITALISAVQFTYTSLLLAEGVRVGLVWRTAEDERVCVICGALDGAAEDVWKMQFPGGPPVHVNCRCILELRPIGR